MFEETKPVEYSRFSDCYSVRRLGQSDISEIYALCCGNPQYYRFCPPSVSKESIAADMQALPPGKDRSDKYYLGFFEEEKLVAIMDFIMGYPDPTTAFIGFFMVDASDQNRGTGSRIIQDLVEYLMGIGISAIRLGWVKNNVQARQFWHRNGFRETGVSYSTDDYTVVVAERLLRNADQNESL